MALKDPIIITGCARSGTSLTAGILAACGAEFGDTLPGNEDNPKGFFEHKGVRENVIKRYLKRIGADPLGQSPLPPRRDLPPYPGLREDVLREMRPTTDNWAIKGAKICLMWEEWRNAFPKARWIIVRRPTKDIVASCMKTKFMRAHSDPDGWSRWVDEHEKRFEDIHKSVQRSSMFYPELMMKGYLNYARAAVDWCGLRWNESAVKAFIDPDSWRTFDKGA